MNRKITVAVLANNAFWAGGIDLVRLWLTALTEKSNGNIIDIYLVLPGRNPELPVSGSRNILYFLSSLKNGILDLLQSESSVSWKLIRLRMILKKTGRLIFGRKAYMTASLSSEQIFKYFKEVEGRFETVFCDNYARPLAFVLKQIKADIVFPVNRSMGKSFPVPWIGYIYDFQDRLLPSLFSKDELAARNVYVAQLLADARSVMVNSVTVRNQVNQFYPGHKCEVFTLPYAPFPRENWLRDVTRENIDKIKGTYSLPEKYFIISNQLWRHKDHITAFEALRLLMNVHGINDFHFVCTGSTRDYRYPRYFDELKQQIRHMGIAPYIHFLGYLPKTDQIQIMYNSVSVIQPTLLEGGPGGGCVYDAIALGVPVILSDIPVNMEIWEEPDIYFFKVRDASDLAEKMLLALKAGHQRPSPEELLQKGKERCRKLGDELMRIIGTTLSHYHSSN